MSLEINSDNDHFVRTGAANLGSVTSGTFLGLYYKNDATNNDLAMVLSKSGASSHFRTVSATEMKVRVINSGNESSPFTANSATWMMLAATVTGSGVFTFYAGPMGGTLAQVYTHNSTVTTEVTTISGGQNGGSFTSARGAYRYFRYWAGRVLTLEEIEDEFAMVPDLGTPAANLTDLYLSWPLPDGTDTTDLTGNGRTPTLSGTATSAEEPTIGGGTDATVTPAPASVTINGRAPSTSTFSNVRIRQVLVSESGTVAGDRTGINLAVWYSGVPTGAPDVSLAGLTTDPNGTTSWSIATGTLALNDPVFMLAYSGSPPDTYTCGRLVPNYE